MADHTISNSKADKYITCPYMVQLHYELGLRSKSLASSLLYGGAIDKALSILLLGGSLTEALQEYAQAMIWSEIAGELVHIPSNIARVDWQKSDYEDCFVPVEEKGEEVNVWQALYYKGQESIKAYQEQVLPRLSNIHSVQKEVTELENEEGDRINGFIDFVAHVDGEGPYILDNKTSDSPYKKERIRTSQQLSIYSAATGILKAGYVVIPKKPRKRDNGKKLSTAMIDIQLIVDELDPAMVDLVMTGMHRISDAIKAKHFPKNLNSCRRVYGKPCVFSINGEPGSCDKLDTSLFHKEKKK